MGYSVASSSPNWRARAIAWVRLETLSLPYMLPVCFFTALTVMYSFSAMSLLANPAQTRRSTSIYRAESGSINPGWAGASAVCHPLNSSSKLRAYAWWALFGAAQ